MPVKQSKVKPRKGQQASGAGDTIVHDARSGDVVIPVIGETGVGKSTFINTAAGKTAMPVGHDLDPCTEHIRHVVVPHPNDPSRRVVFVDTPGFNNTYTADVGDSAIFARLDLWLRKSYSDSMKFSGLIYLQDISQARVVGTPLRDMLAMLKKLSCFNGTQSIILATTKWGGETEERCRAHEELLSANSWKDAIGQGARMAQFRDHQASAWAMIDLILPEKAKPMILLLGQTGAGKSTFINTAAGRCVTVVGSDIISCTSLIMDFEVQRPDDPTCPVVLVDTPGFNDSSTSDDADTLKRMIEWLKHRSQGAKLVGFIYLHEITQTRVDLSPAVVTPMKLSRPGVLRKVVLATTKWGEVLSDVGQRHESQLTEMYWKNLLRQGMQTTRFADTQKSAWEIIDLVLNQESVESSLLEQELVQVMTRLPQKTPPKAIFRMPWRG
ncbi:hypothetical protein BV22DRAFT_1034061 [Leucogyrophana mollusca]|uniref:Uncharacterized protein n=1 Tax=Leucogyrophana mollusca TaxID=85980 RepID=A0ACB8BHP4_9AGAM|nr:hypothetical protein BV22DRAFT_1034061 [Leucogyrophana mollusca]